MKVKHLVWSFQSWYRRIPERLTMWIVWRMPHQMVMWAYIRVGAYATCGKYGTDSPTDIGMMEALDRWNKING